MPVTRRTPRPARQRAGAREARRLADHAGSAAALLKALANEHRLMILCLLAGGERSVGEINEGVPLSQSALSQHLALLREDGLVTTRREARTVLYALAGGPAERLIGALHAIYCGGR